MPVADTSWLVALHVTSDAFHEDAARQAEKESDIIVPDVILGEFLNTIYVLAGGRKRHAGAWAGARAVLADMEANRAVRFTTDSEPDASRQLFREDALLSHPGAVAIRVAWRERQWLLTFDRHQMERQRELGVIDSKERRTRAGAR